MLNETEVAALSEAVARHMRRIRDDLRHELAVLRAEVGEARREAAAAKALSEAATRRPAKGAAR